MAKKRKRPIKRYAVIAALAIALLAGSAQAACLGFNDEQMPAEASAYLCQFGALSAQVIGVQAVPDGSALEAAQLLDGDGVVVGFVLTELRPDGGYGRILYLQDVKGNVLLDRREPVKLKGQEG